MKNALSICTASILLYACSAVAIAPSQSFRPKGADNPITIRGKIDRDEGLFTVQHTLSLRLDGVDVMAGKIGGGNGEVHGKWNDRPIIAMCHRTGDYSGPYSIHCRIIIDGEFATTLTF